MVKVSIAAALMLLSFGAAFVWIDDKALDTAWETVAARLPAGLVTAKSAATSTGTAATEQAATTEPRSPQNGAPRSIAVEAAPAVATRSTEDLRAIGTLQSDESVQIASEIAGRVTEIALSEGAAVKAGDVMVKLDDSLAVAEVSDTQARFNLAEGNLARANSLAKSGNVTERARDEASTASETSRAALELAKVRLDKHTIRAPFSGIAGIRKVSPGAYITAGQAIVNLEKIDTLKIDFKLPELFLAQVAVGQEIEITVDALPGRTFAGTIYVIDPHLDVNGRALAIRARLDNPGLVLRPGLFARVRVKGQIQRDAVVIPESAVVPRGADKIVYRVENGKVHEAKVTLGNRLKGMVEVLDGLSEDAIVVTAGQQKIRDGSAVDIVTGTSSTGSTGSVPSGGGQAGARGT